MNFLEQVKAFEDSFGPMMPTKEMYKVIELTRTVQDGDEECDETYEETVLASEVRFMQPGTGLWHSYSFQEWTANAIRKP